MDRRVRYMSRRPNVTKLADRVVATANIEVDAVTNVELAPNSVTTDSIVDGAITIDLIDPAAQDELGGIDSTKSSGPPLNPADGDFWIDTSSNNELKRYNATSSAWESVRDLTIATAQSAANAAQSTADGKNKVFRQNTAPTATATGDIWFDTGNDNRINRWDGTAWVANNLGNNAITSLSANKITAGTIDASVITVSNINAGNISTGTIASGRISSSSIAAGVIDASKITTGTLGASVVYAGTISAGNITAGTLSASVALSATSGTIGGWSISASTLSSGGVTLNSSGVISSAYTNGGNTTNTTINNPDNSWAIYISGNWTNSAGKMGPNGFAAQNVPSPGQFILMWYDNVTFSSSTSFDVFGEPSIFYPGIRYPGASYGPGNNNAMALQWTGSQAFVVIDNVAGQYLGGSVFSDRRYKRNIAEPEQAWIDKILNDLKIWQFNKINPLNDEDLHLYPLEIGVIADEYKQVFPQWESSSLLSDPDGADADMIRSVDYTGLIPGLVLIAQKFNADIALLEQRVAALEA